MPLLAGTRFGPYEILAPIGAGGMGEVYRARDTKLKRDVAVKVLPDAFARDPERMARFQREAQVLASLNHPNIAQIYGVEGSALVMEFVEGDSPQGPLPFEETWKIASQIADALEDAHDKGVIHRDLKPANVKVTPQGVVKLLDFGLAKVFHDTPAPAPLGSGDLSNSPTLTFGKTVAGTVMGTAAYMAPEQARGKPVDKRADIWAWGVVFYELLTGERLFKGDDTADTLARVLTKEPDLSRVPPKVQRLLHACLQKDPKKRLRDIADAKGMLAEGTDVVAARPRLGAIATVVAIVATTALAALAYVHFREQAIEERILSAAILPPENTSFDFVTSQNPPALSPDGQRIVFGARGTDGKTQLWIRALDSSTARPLAGTENATFPFWSPDSKSVAFFASGKLKRVDVAGGMVLALAGVTLPRGGSWSREGVIVYNSGGNGNMLVRVPETGGTPSRATASLAPGDNSHRFPWFLPDGRHFLFEDQTQIGTNNNILRIGALDSKEIKTVGPTTSNGVYSNGYLLFLRDGALMAQPFDAQRLAVTGDPTPLAEQVRSVVAAGSTGVFSASSGGLLAYQSGVSAGGQQLTWFDRGGKPQGTLGDPGDFYSIEFSPDRRRLAASRIGQNTNLWLYDVARGLPTRFTSTPATDRSEVWSPDGRGIAYSSNLKGQLDLYRKSSDFNGAEEVLFADSSRKDASSWSPDGKFLLFSRVDAKTESDIWVLPMGAGDSKGEPGKPYPWLATPATERWAKFSPDGRWVAYESNDSGRVEIYIAPFPGPGPKRQLSAGGGAFPRWRGDGKEIFYLDPDGTLVAAEVASKGDSIEVGTVRSLGIRVIDLGNNYLYDVSADGQRFLVTAAPQQKFSAPLTLVYNWPLLLRKK